MKLPQTGTLQELESLGRCNGCEELQCDAKMATHYRHFSYLDTAAVPHWWRSSGSPIRVDGNGHSLDLKGSFLRCHYV
jgi:hypothetical protein